MNENQLNLFGKTLAEQEEEENRGEEIICNVQNQRAIISLNGVLVQIKFKRDFSSDSDDKDKKFYEGGYYVPHIEIQSVKKEEPNILTETGYRSCFFDCNIMLYAKDFKGMVEEVLKNEFEYDWKGKGKRALKNKLILNIKWNN